MNNWQKKNPILKTIKEVIHTIRVRYMKYYAMMTKLKNW